MGTRNQESEIVDIENFKSYDSNNDGILDAQEIRDWALPNQETAEDEADHLMEESDVDGDHKLSKEEILNNYDLWVGSLATDYLGPNTHDPGEL